MNKLSLLLMALVVFSSACVSLSDMFQGSFGKTTVEETADIVVMQSKQTIPNPPVLAGNDFIVAFTLRNDDVKQDVSNVGLKLYNWGPCTANKDKFEPDPDEWTPDVPSNPKTYTRTFAELVPQQEESIELAFTAPSNQQIGFLRTTCPIKWLVEYKFSARSQDDFTIISATKQKQLQRAGQPWEGTDEAPLAGIGPVKVLFRWLSQIPVQSKGPLQFTLQVVDRGPGWSKEAAKGSMFLKIPLDWGDEGNACTDKFERIDDENAFAVYRNAKAINLIKRESAEISCKFRAPNLDDPLTALNVPERSYLVVSNITDYNYQMFDEQAVDINPSQ